MAKPVDRDLMFYPRSVFSIFDYETLQPTSVVRMDREYQGWSELTACTLDRILKFNRKPTIVGRFLESSQVYEYDYSFWGRIYYSLPNTLVPVGSISPFTFFQLSLIFILPIGGFYACLGVRVG